MTYDVHVRRAAELDVAEAQLWYEAQLVGLGTDFHSEVSQVIDRLSDSPLIYQAVLFLCVVGTILPYSFLVPFLREHGLDFRLFFEQLFANSISGFFGVDIIVSSVCLWVLIYFEGRRSRVRHLWAPVVASLTVGLSLALPLFLYLREVRIGQD